MIPSVQLSLNVINGTTISTVLLYKNTDRSPEKFETCMFYPNGDSDVVAMYSSRQEAIDGHNRIVRHEFEHADAQSNRQMWVQA
jgi:hypothetical protein